MIDQTCGCQCNLWHDLWWKTSTTNNNNQTKTTTTAKVMNWKLIVCFCFFFLYKNCVHRIDGSVEITNPRCEWDFRNSSANRWRYIQHGVFDLAEEPRTFASESQKIFRLEISDTDQPSEAGSTRASLFEGNRVSVLWLLRRLGGWEGDGNEFNFWVKRARTICTPHVHMLCAFQRTAESLLGPLSNL